MKSRSPRASVAGSARARPRGRLTNAPRKKKRPYDVALRREQAEATKARIVEATSKLLRRMRPEELSYAEVAELAGVAVRTVYRHFPALPDLLRAVARQTISRFASEGLSRSRPENAAQLAAFHRTLSAEPSLFRIFMAAPVRSELDAGANILTLHADALDGLSEPERNALAGLLELLSSPFAWEILHTHWSLPPERITRACLAAAQLLADGLRRHREWLDPAAPPPPMFRAPEALPSDSKKRPARRSKQE